VCAIGDVATVGVPKAGVFADGAARVVAASLLATLRNGAQPTAYDGRGSCYIEFGSGRVGRVDIDFLSAAKPTGTFRGPSRTLVAETALRRQPTRPLVRPPHPGPNVRARLRSNEAPPPLENALQIRGCRLRPR
jgi:hypothetical protein